MLDDTLTAAPLEFLEARLIFQLQPPLFIGRLAKFRAPEGKPLGRCRGGRRANIWHYPLAKPVSAMRQPMVKHGLFPPAFPSGLRAATRLLPRLTPTGCRYQ